MPNHYLLLLHIGPVQDFIAKARRTRDLWFGSFVLSEISKAAAYVLYQQPAVKLIFPYPSPDTTNPQSNPEIARKLQPCANSQDPNYTGVANRILVEYQGDQPKELLQQASQAAKQRWRELATAVQKEANSIIDSSYWHHQIDDVVETYSIWMPIKDGQDAYQTALNQLLQIEQGRRNLRNFSQSVVDKTGKGYGKPKSSLDAANETVLKEKIRASRRRYGLGEGEQLDASGMVKRLGGDPEQFVPVSRFAIDAWLLKVAKNKEDLSRLNQVKDVLNRDFDVLNGVITRLKVEEFDLFPFDAQLLFPYRLEAEKAAIARDLQSQEIQQDQLVQTQLKQIQAVLDEIARLMRPLYKKYGEPCPYLALIQADGDKMGELLDKATTPQQHRTISHQLDQFASGVPKIFAEFRGQAIYSGGDDVLGLIALDQAIECADALRQAFENQLNLIADALGARTPTLSVGLALSHFMTPLGYMRELAKRAEKAAKGDALPDAQQRNALGILLNIRSGQELIYRLQWQQKPAAFLKKWQSYYNGLLPSADADESELKANTALGEGILPSNTVYALYQLLEEMQHLHPDALKNDQSFLQNELLRVLQRRRGSSGALPDWLLETFHCRLRDFQVLNTENALKALQQLADELMTARWLAQKMGDR